MAREGWKEPRAGEEPERMMVSPYLVGAKTVKRRVGVGGGVREREVIEGVESFGWDGDILRGIQSGGKVKRIRRWIAVR